MKKIGMTAVKTKKITAKAKKATTKKVATKKTTKRRPSLLGETFRPKASLITEKLPETFKQNWLMALRSGDYKQGKALLLSIKENSKTYCCIGVAGKICEIGDEHLLNSTYMTEASANTPTSAKLIRTRIPKALRNNYALQKKLAEYNDAGYTFREIAQWIEKYL